MCLRFEQLPLHCLNHSEDTPVAVLAQQRVLRANDCAAALGIRPGMGTSTVRALAGDEPVQLLERDEQAEQRALQQLCCWAYSITPTLHIARADCLQLEIGGCLALFRGLDALLDEVRSGISSRHYSAALGLAPTPGAAWLLSHAEPGNALAITTALEERLAGLPLQLLDEFDTAVDSLRRAGLHTLGDILALPAAALARRCGKAFTHFLQQVLGRADDRQPNYQPPATFSDQYWFGYEVKTNAELMPAVQKLLQAFCLFLRNTQLRSSEIHWQLLGIDHRVRTVCVRSSTSHSDWQNWHQLTRIRFEQLALEGSVEGLALVCEQLTPGQQDNIDLFSPRNQREPLASLVDRLRNRLGLQAIETMGCRDEHLPELAMLVSSEPPPDALPPGNHCLQRPFWLMPEPAPLRQRGKTLYWHGALRLVYGPERIEDNWWQTPVSRDYYIATGEAGQHYWVFYDRLGKSWLIQGIFA